MFIDVMTPEIMERMRTQSPALYRSLAPRYYSWLAMGPYVWMMNLWLAPARIWLELAAEQARASSEARHETHTS